jgi:hypothetical protein
MFKMSKFQAIPSKVNSRRKDSPANVTTKNKELVPKPETQAIELKPPSDEENASNETKAVKFKE